MHLLVAMELLCLQLWAPEGNLAQPVPENGERNHDQMGVGPLLLKCQRCEECNALQGLACARVARG